MPDLTFTVEGAEAVPFAAAPMVGLKLRVTNANPGEQIHSVILRAQIQIEATRRRYSDREKASLGDLFGEPDRWTRTLRALLWTHAGTVLPAFQGSIVTDLQIPCTFDFNVGATKYFYGLHEGEIPLNLLFSGTVFFPRTDGALQVSPISWDKEARYRLPVQTWREMMDLYYPNSAWLNVRRDLFDQLYAFKAWRGLQTWEEAFEMLLKSAQEPTPR